MWPGDGPGPARDQGKHLKGDFSPSQLKGRKERRDKEPLCPRTGW